MVSNFNVVPLLVLAAMPSVLLVVSDRLYGGIEGSKPARGMDVCRRVSALCPPVYVEALRWADPPSKDSYQNFEKGIHSFRS
jgi:hypothetical protein